LTQQQVQIGKIMDKETWEMDDYRKMASMAQFMVELLEER
jgi:hypothetical protein